MVSNARLDLPLPLGPVITVNFPSGRSRSMPFRLFCRAPRISTHPALADAVTRFCSIALEVTEDIPRRRRNSQGGSVCAHGEKVGNVPKNLQGQASTVSPNA